MKNLFILILPAIALIVGCGGPARPSDLPKLYPVKITITQQGDPCEEATVFLANDDANSKWVVTGVTDKSGVAVLKTNGTYDGAPAGSYKISVRKDEYVREGESLPGSPAPITAQFQLIEGKYTLPTTSGLTIEIKGKTQETFDVGEPVKNSVPRV
ncbi:MAG: hypothetical protein ACRC2T_15035 [Thermoguttaceae bacterium]